MGGSGGSYTDWDTNKLAGAMREESDKASAEFEQELAGFLSDLLAAFNARDVDLVRERLEIAKRALEDEFENTVDQLFGGSVAKHTYVDGLSDIDSLLIMKPGDQETTSPREMLDKMGLKLAAVLPKDVHLSHGDMALTLTYPDGMNIQLLPAFRTDTGLKVPKAGENTWSEIDTEAFTQALTRRNEECGGKLVPTIKLAKAALAALPEEYRLTGYHTESLAIAAFAGFDGTKTTTSMLPYFFACAKVLVLAPIRDSTGQSVHVDEYLGSENSHARQIVSHLLDRLAKRMRNASAAKSNAQWKSVFLPEE